MQIPSFLSSKKTAKDEIHLMLALQIGSHLSKAALWRQVNNAIEIENVIEGLTPEEVIRKATEKEKVTQVLFGLNNDFVEDDKIKDDHIPQLKRIAELFHLSPLGFVIIPEAIAHYLESEQGSPQTAIFVTLSQTKLIFTLCRVGKITHTVTTNRTENLIYDFETGLSQFSDEEVLPSKIIIDNEDISLTNLKDELLNYPWQNNDKFLHVPKIELLPWEFSIEAIVNAGISEINESAAQKLSYSASEVQNNDQIADNDTIVPIHTTKNENTFGFSSEDQQIFNTVPDIEQETIIVNTPPSVLLHSETDSIPRTSSIQSRMDHPSQIPMEKKIFPTISVPKLSLPFPKNFALPSPRGLLPAVIGIVLLIIGAGVMIYAYPSTTITLLIEPEVAEDEISLRLNTNSSEINVSEGEIPGKVHSVTVSSTKTGEATGTKIIGEKATGKIALYNKSSSEKFFEKGAVLGISDVQFVLDEDIKVASASDTGESLNYGKTSVSVTALKIGPNGNIDSNLELTIDGLPKSTAVAKTEEKFSGGTEREVTIVSEEDITRLLDDATEDLKSNAREQLSAQISEDEKFLDESISENIVEKKLDVDIGEESEIVSLDLLLEISQTSYKVEDINKYLEGYMQNQIKEGYKLDSKKSYFRVIDSKEDDKGNFTFTANYHAFLIPEVSLDGFKGKLAGISTAQLDKLVKDLADQNIVGYEITRNRSIPFFGSRLPFFKNNIKVEVEIFE